MFAFKFKVQKSVH